MSLFDPAFNPQSSLLQPIASTPNPVPWLPTHDVAELAPVIDDMAAIPVPWQPRQDLFELVPVNDDTAAIPFAGATPSGVPVAASPMGQPLGLAAQSGDLVTGLAATQATANSGGVQTFDGPTGSTQTFDPTGSSESFNPDSVDTFSNGSDWRKAFGGYASTSTNAAYGSFLGPFANGPKELGQDVFKNFKLGSRGGTISFDFYRFDSWDNETFSVYANNVQILSSSFNGWENVSSVRSGSANGYSWTIDPVNDFAGNNNYTRQSFHVTIVTPAGVQNLQLGFGSSLDEKTVNESYGIDNVSVSSAPEGWTAAAGVVPTGSNLAYGSFMGPFANGPKVAGQDVWKTFDLATQGRTISFDFYRFDTWDQESFKVYANDVTIISSTFGWENNVTQVRTGTTNGYTWTIAPVKDYSSDARGIVWSKQSFHVTITAPSAVDTLKLGFGSTLDEAANNESYGIDNVLVSSPSAGWTAASGTVPIGTSNTYGSFMGPFANGPKVAGQDVWKTFDLASQGRTISFDFYRFDTWDQEAFNVYANDVIILSSTFGWDTNVTQMRTGTTNSYNWSIIPVNNYVKDIAGWKFSQSFHVTITALSSVNTLKLGFGSTLDSAAIDESYGIDNVLVSSAAEGWIAASGAVPISHSNPSDSFYYRQGSFMGPFANGPKVAGQDVWKTFDLSATQDRTISFDLLRIDSWDNENFNVYANDEIILSSNFDWHENILSSRSGTSASGYSWVMTPLSNGDGDFIGPNGGWGQQSFRVTISIPTFIPGIKLGFGSTLNEDAQNESYGIDNVLLYNSDRIVYANSFQDNTNGFTSPWRESAPGYDQFLGRFGYDSGTELSIGVGTPYTYTRLGQFPTVSIQYDFLRFDDWHGQVMHFKMDFEYGYPALRFNTGVDLVKSFEEDHPSGSFDLVGSYDFYGEGDGDDLDKHTASIIMHFEQTNYGLLGFGPSHDEFFHVSIYFQSEGGGGSRYGDFLGDKIKLSWYADNPKNRDTRSWGIDNMLITKPNGSAQSQSLVASQIAPNGIFASNAIPVVARAAVITPSTSPLLSFPSEPSNGLPSSVDSSLSTSNAQVATRLKPVLYRAALKASQVAKRLISL